MKIKLLLMRERRNGNIHTVSFFLQSTRYCDRKKGDTNDRAFRHNVVTAASSLNRT